MIDISAVLLTIVSLTGIGLLLHIKRRQNGLLSILGELVVLLVVPAMKSRDTRGRHPALPVLSFRR